jgi:hypothetical protein
MLLVEPLSANLNIRTFYSSCRVEVKKESSCSKTKCNKPPADNQEEDCSDERCNPIMSCPAGNFYFANPAHFSFTHFPLSGQKKLLLDDNRISGYLSECWHPPEII